MSGHLQFGCKVLQLQLVQDTGRRTHHDFHGFQALVANLVALPIDVLDQALRGTLKQVTELLLRELQGIQQAVQDTWILTIPLARLPGQQERASKRPTGQQEGLMNLHQKSGTDQTLDGLRSLSVFLIGRR